MIMVRHHHVAHFDPGYAHRAHGVIQRMHVPFFGYMLAGRRPGAGPDDAVGEAILSWEQTLGKLSSTESL